MARASRTHGSGDLEQALKADFQKPEWVTTKQLDANRYMFWSTSQADLSSNSLSYVGHDIVSGVNWAPLTWFGQNFAIGTSPTTFASYQLAAQKEFPLQTVYGSARGSQALSDAIVGPDFIFPPHDWYRKVAVSIEGAPDLGSVVDASNSGTWHRVLYAKHRFHWENYSRHPVKIACVFQSHVSTSTSGSVPDLFDESLTNPGPDLKRLPNVTILHVPGAFDNEGSQPGRSYYDIPFSPKEFNKEAYSKPPLGGNVTTENGLWRKLNTHQSTAFLKKTAVTTSWHDATSPWETVSVDANLTFGAAHVMFWARFDIPMANISMPSYTPKVEGAPAELSDSYKLLNMRVESRFLNELRQSEMVSGYYGKNPIAIPTAV